MWENRTGGPSLGDSTEAAGQNTPLYIHMAGQELSKADVALARRSHGLCDPERGKRTKENRKERKKTDNPREGWEDGTPPPHRDFKENRT